VFVLVAICVGQNLHAQSCAAKVENTENKLVKNTFFTQWRISHDGGHTLKRVSFEYHIRYVNKRGDTLVEDGASAEVVDGAGKKYTKENTSVNDPSQIFSVDFDRILCSR
jgi:hypothetical protein